jgi:UDP-glucose:(heptosyl)LPS alpha-1,3-glucosyltransferase
MARWLKVFDPAVRSYRIIERRQFQLARVVIVNSEMVREHAALYLSRPTTQIRVIHAAVSPNRFRDDDRATVRRQVRQSWGIAEPTVVGLFIAMNYQLKGLSPLLRAIRGLPSCSDFKLVVTGSPRTAHFQRQASRMGITDRVHFHGFCSDARHVYFASDFLIHPTFYDPCSLVVLEALACGLPVITTRFNGAAELMNPPHDGIVLEDPHQEEKLTQALLSMLDPDRRRDARQAALQSAARWTFEDHYHKLMAILESCARSQASYDLQTAC